MRVRQKRIAAKQILDFMLEQKNLVSEEEYRKIVNVPLRLAQIRYFFRTWERLLATLEQEFPEEYKKLAAYHKLRAVKAAKETPAAETAPKAATV